MIEDITYIEVTTPGQIIKTGSMGMRQPEKVDVFLMVKTHGEWKEIQTNSYQLEKGEELCLETIMAEYEKINSCQKPPRDIHH